LHGSIELAIPYNPLVAPNISGLSAIQAELNRVLYNSGKHGKPGKLREFFNSGKHRENSGNFKFTQEIFVSVIVGV